jgi:hypothetical protein
MQLKSYTLHSTLQYIVFWAQGQRQCCSPRMDGVGLHEEAQLVAGSPTTFFKFFKFYFFLIDFSISDIHSYFFTYIHLHSLKLLCVSSSQVPLSAERLPCGCQVGNQTWDCRTAVRRASNLATPHPCSPTTLTAVELPEKSAQEPSGTVYRRQSTVCRSPPPVCQYDAGGSPSPSRERRRGATAGDGCLAQTDKSFS